MIFHAVSVYSNVSEAAAISQATSIASDGLGKDAKIIHVIIDAVFKIGEGWKSIVRILIEPVLEEKRTESIIEELPPHYEAKRDMKENEEDTRRLNDSLKSPRVEEKIRTYLEELVLE